MKLDRLAPCPHCGSISIDHDGMSDDEQFYVCCMDCWASSGKKATRAEAIAAWNKRHVPEGFAIVPVEPTEGMKMAGCTNGSRRIGPIGAGDVWHAMLSAAKGDE